jgi:hypothetical protein
MSVTEAGATLGKLPAPADIDYKWTDIVIRRRIGDVNKPIEEQNIKLAVRCIGTVDGADEAMDDVEISMVMDTEALLALSTTAKSQIKKFVALCEKGCANENQTHTDDFSLSNS